MKRMTNLRAMLVALGLAAALAGCSSGVKLNDVPVEDRSAAQVTAPVPGGGGTPGAGATGGAAGGGGAGGTAQSRVAPVQVDATGPGGVAPQGVARVLYFDYDSFVIKPEFQPLIDSHARFLKANGTRKISVEGHTDERGGREYNLALGQKRAEAVRRALTLLGVGDAQVEAVSFGKEKPADAGGEEASWAKNRRAELGYR